MPDSKPAAAFARRLPAKLYQQVTRAFEHRFPGPHRPAGDEVLIDSTWRIQLDPGCGTLTRLAADHLTAALAQVFGVRLKTHGSRVLAVQTAAADPSNESSQWRIGSEGVQIRAASDEAAMRALFDIYWQMLNRQAPVLKRGARQMKPAWSLRLMSPVWHRAIDRADDYLALPEAYLLNAARYGYNATFLFADWMDYMTPASGGALARAGYRDRLAKLRQTVAYLGRFGIRLLMHINTLAMPRDHAFFRANPALRGAQTWRDGMHCLCSGHPRMLRLYRDAAAQLMRDVPGLGGAVMITGGECFLHCYTRPTPATARGTNCPRCAKRPPQRVIADMVNAFAQGAREANPRALLLMWPYSAFTWGDVHAQQGLIHNLDRRVDLLTSFEKDAWRKLDGARSYVFDYSISEMGPSPLFRALHRSARQDGRRVYARTESAQCIEMFNVPRIPIMHRWAQRFAGIKRIGVDGVHTAWRFYGFCAQRNDEIIYAATWRRKLDADELLTTMAQRDFGAAAGRWAVQAWRQFSDGFAAFPYCAGVTGFPYFRGPFYLGPAHPFVFDTTRQHGVPEMFWTPSPAAGEADSGASRSHLPREPRFFIDLSWTQPYGGQRVAEALAMVDRHWRRGMSALERGLKLAAGRQRAAIRDEYRVAAMVQCMIRTALNLVRFQMLREQVTSQPSTPASLRKTCTQAAALLHDELASARTALQLVRDDPSLGYGATYGYAFTAQHIEAKITQCQYQLQRVIPAFYDNHAFHCFGMKDRGL